MVQPGRHDRVQDVIDPRDAIEHRADLPLFERAGGAQLPSPLSWERKATRSAFFCSGSPRNDGIGAVGLSRVRRIAAAGSRTPIAVRFGPGPLLPFSPILWQARQPDCAATSFPGSYLAATLYSISFGDPAAA